jgi:hypothetical protein
MAETLRHALPLLAAGQAQKEITHNEALLAIDRKLHLAVLSMQVAMPPAAPAAGDAYIVPAGALGAWAGQSGRVASFDGFGWLLSAPVMGTLALVQDLGVFAFFDGLWRADAWPVASLSVDGRSVLAAPAVAVAGPSGGGVVDSQCRQAVDALISALRSQGVIL